MTDYETHLNALKLILKLEAENQYSKSYINTLESLIEDYKHNIERLQTQLDKMTQNRQKKEEPK